MSQELANIGPSFSEMQQAGSVFFNSGLFTDLKNEAQAVVKVMAGAELGIAPFASINGIYLVQGKVTVGANLMAQRVKQSGKYDYEVLQMEDTICEIQFLELRREWIGLSSKTERVLLGVSQFTIEDAKKAGTQNTQKFARNMLFARAMSNGVRWYCPDVFTTTVYTPEEMGAKVDGEGNVVEPPRPEVAPVTEEVPEGEVEESPAAETLSDRDLIQWRNWARDNQLSTKHAEYQAEINIRKAAREAPKEEAKPQTLPQAVAAKVETAKQGNAEEEADFDHDAQGVSVAAPVAESDLLTDAQKRAIPSIAGRLFGRGAARDAEVLKLAGKDPDTLTKREASVLIDELRAMLEVSEREQGAAPATESNKHAHIYTAAKKAGVIGTDRTARLRGVNAFFADLKGNQSPIESFADLLPGSDMALIGALEDGKFGKNWEFPVVEGEISA